MAKKKRHLSKEEREDIQVVMEATQKLLPFYEQLNNASEYLTEDERHMLDQIRQTLEDVLEFSGMMIGQIHVMQFENAVDTIFSGKQRLSADDQELPADCQDEHQSFVEYLKDSVNEQLN
ncbi:MAG: hypothetical protein V4714_04430 [Bacteroidota bacterium]